MAEIRPTLKNLNIGSLSHLKTKSFEVCHYEFLSLFFAVQVFFSHFFTSFRLYISDDHGLRKDQKLLEVAETHLSQDEPGGRREGLHGVQEFPQDGQVSTGSISICSRFRMCPPVTLEAQKRITKWIIFNFFAEVFRKYMLVLEVLQGYIYGV